jgi:hypothetical protein
MRSSIIYILQTLLGYQIKEDEMDGYVACMGEKRNSYKILVGMFVGNKQLRRSRHRLEGNIKV